MPEADALTDVDALQEANLVDVRLLAHESSVAAIFDLRTALQFRMANTALMVMHGLRHVEWHGVEALGSSRIAHTVVSSEPNATQGLFTFGLVCLHGWRLTAVAGSAEFFVGDVPELPEVPPDFVEDDDETIEKGMPSWNSSFAPGWATFLEGLPSR
jgi:hypothetical protein